MARRPVTAMLHEVHEDGHSELIVVCDDGSVWTHVADEDSWHQLAPIPGSPADPDAPKPEPPKASASY